MCGARGFKYARVAHFRFRAKPSRSPQPWAKNTLHEDEIRLASEGASAPIARGKCFQESQVAVL